MRTSLISDQLRIAIVAYGSGYALAAAAGVHRSVVCRFLAGRSVTVDTVDALAEVLGLRLVQSRSARRRKRATGSS